MDAFEEILALLKENNRLLKEVREMLKLQMEEDNEYTRTQDLRAFCINVTADLFVEMMNDDKEFREKIMEHFKSK